MSGGSQPQFRYTQPPSKVLHIRNLPWEVSDEELVELCKPFGHVINTKLNVGANHNQAFVEFENLNQAIQMVSYFASSNEPAQVRGKAVYLQYSTRQEIVTSKNSGDVASNVLLVTIEGVDNGDVSIDVLHVVFSAFGFVHKIATFEKTSGYQALVQFGDPTTATSAKTALEGRSIPRYLLADTVGEHSLKINYSAHNDLNVKFQSHRSRDYTNLYLPVAPSATDGNVPVGADGKKREPESNVLLVSIDNMQYAVTLDVLHTVFSAFGVVQKIAIFEKTAGFQALVQYPDIPTAVAAKDALEGHCIYDGGYCKLRLSYSRHTDLNVKANNERSRDYTNPNLPAQPLPQATGQQPAGSAPPQQQQQGPPQQQQQPPSQGMPSMPRGGSEEYNAYAPTRPPFQSGGQGVLSSAPPGVIPPRPTGFDFDPTYGRGSMGGPPPGARPAGGPGGPGMAPPSGAPVPPGPPAHGQGQYMGGPPPPHGGPSAIGGPPPARGHPPSGPPGGPPGGYGPPPGMNVGPPGGSYPGPPPGARGPPAGPGNGAMSHMHPQGPHPPHFGGPMGPPPSQPMGMGPPPPHMGNQYGPPPHHSAGPGGPPPPGPYGPRGGYM